MHRYMIIIYKFISAVGVRVYEFFLYPVKLLFESCLRENYVHMRSDGENGRPSKPAINWLSHVDPLVTIVSACTVIDWSQTLRRQTGSLLCHAYNDYSTNTLYRVIICILCAVLDFGTCETKYYFIFEHINGKSSIGSIVNRKMLFTSPVPLKRNDDFNSDVLRHKIGL